MSAAQSLALSFLIAQHNAEQKPAEPVARTVRNAKTEAAPIPQPVKAAGMTLGLSLPAVGTLDARAFIVAMRRTTDRNEQIKAIAAYVGYDPKGNFGSQESAARTKAQRELNPTPITGLSRAEVRAASRSMTGFVAGLPDNLQRKLADLKAREVAAVDAMLAHQKDAKDPNRSDDERLLSSGLAEVERERLREIRGFIKALPL